MPGAFAEYIVQYVTQLNITSDFLLTRRRSHLAVGAEILIIGSGPPGLLLALLLKNLGYSKLTIASNKGPKMDWAKAHKVADEYIELDRSNKAVAAKQWQKLKEDNPHGFDIVIEASGVAALAEKAFDYARRGGQILMYGVYPESDTIKVNPFNVDRFTDPSRM